MFISTAYANTAETVSRGFNFMDLLPFLMIFIVMYFLIFRPQQKKLKEHKSMVESLKKGDRVVTGGGLIGVIANTPKGEEIEIEISKGVTVLVLRSTITMMVSDLKPVKGVPANDTKPAKKQLRS